MNGLKLSRLVFIVVIMTMALAAACSSSPAPTPTPLPTATPVPTPTPTPVPVDDTKLLAQFYEDFMVKAVARDYQGLYDMCSLDRKASVSFEEFRQVILELNVSFPPEGIQLRNFNFNVNGDMAFADYDVYNRGELLTHYESGELIKVAGKWLWDSEKDC